MRVLILILATSLLSVSASAENLFCARALRSAVQRAERAQHRKLWRLNHILPKILATTKVASPSQALAGLAPYRNREIVFKLTYKDDLGARRTESVAGKMLRIEKEKGLLLLDRPDIPKGHAIPIESAEIDYGSIRILPDDTVLKSYLFGLSNQEGVAIRIELDTEEFAGGSAGW